MSKTKTLTELEMNEAGNKLARILHLKRDTEHRDRWKTEWGTKTGLGLFLTVARFMDDPRELLEDKANA